MNDTFILRKKSMLVSAALATACALALGRSASAQYQANQDGHALDASNRVGSAGYNTATRTNGAVGYTANDVALRNVTAGREFRGPIGERDPRAFSGPLNSSPSDLFNRQSNVNPSIGGTGNFGQAQSYYGETRFAPPPAGSLPVGFNGGYIGTTLNTPLSLSSGQNSAYDASSLTAKTSDRDTFAFNRDINSPNYAQTINNAEVSQYGTLGVSATPGLQTYSIGHENPNVPQLPDFDSRASADDMSVLRMRDELRQSTDNSLNGANSLNRNAAKPGANPNDPNNPNNPAANGLNQPLNQPLGQSFDAPQSASLSSLSSAQPLDDRIGAKPVVTSQADRDRQSSLLPSAMEQSTLLSTLQSRLEQAGGVGRAITDARPAVSPNMKYNPNAAKPVITPPKPEQGPVPVSSLATGTKAKGLHDLLASSEDLIRQGKFDSSIQQYNQALRVAPNNPLPVLGRAHAELAGGYYARAEMDLRTVFRNDPELLMAQFDLASLFPADRLSFVRKDLRDLTESDPKAERPWFLLAYLDYNTGDAATADKDLKEAEQRSGRADWSVRALRQHWALPSPPSPGPATPRAAAPTQAPRPASQTTLPASPLNK